MTNRQFEIYYPVDDENVTDSENARISDYKMVYSKKMADDDTIESVLLLLDLKKPANLREKSLAIGDVILIKEDEKVEAFYCDTSGFINLPDFTKKKDIDLKSTSLEIDGMSGTWRALDKAESEGKSYFLLENEQHPDDVAYIMVDNTGKLLNDNILDGQFLQAVEAIKADEAGFDAKDPRKNYLRSIEEGEEGSYSQIDGVISVTPSQKFKSNSLLGKLHEYQEILHSKPAPKDEPCLQN